MPRYREPWQDDDTILWVPTLMAFGEKREFRLTNPFSARFRRCLREFKPDVIHVHHPFWLGSMGLWMGRRLKVLVIYTYHTRLEHYAHFVPLPGALFRNLISHYLIKHFSNRCQGVIVPTYSAEEYLRMIGVKTPGYRPRRHSAGERIPNQQREEHSIRHCGGGVNERVIVDALQ